MSKKYIDIKPDDESYRKYTSDTRAHNVFRIHYSSDTYGAMADIGEVHIQNFDKEKDELVFIDLKGKWTSPQDFKNGLWMKEDHNKMVIPFRCDVLSRLKNRENNLILDGVKRKARYINKIDNLDIKISFESIMNKEQE